MYRSILINIFFLSFILHNIETKAQPINTLSYPEKIYGLSRFWQEVNYNFVYFDKVDKNMWDSTYLRLIATIGNTDNDYAYYLELQRFCALLNDGHTNIILPPTITEYRTMFGEYRIFFESIEGKAIVSHINQSKTDILPVGSELVHVNGMPAQEYINRYIKPYISANANYIRDDLSIKSVLRGLEGDSYEVIFKRPDSTFLELQLTHARTEEEQMFPPLNMAPLLEFNKLDNEIGYLAINSFENKEIVNKFLSILPELYGCKALIIDLRKNGGGSTNHALSILQYFTADTLLGASVSTRKHLPYFKAVGSFIDHASDTIGNPWLKKAYEIHLGIHMEPMGVNGYISEVPRDKRLIVPTIFLTGHGTASAAEDMLIYADGQQHMMRIGQRTFASTGQPYLFDLPGGARARVCTKKDTFADGREFVGVGVQPHIEVIPSLNDWLGGKDPILEAALEYLNR
jgi:hypothetical protein